MTEDVLYGQTGRKDGHNRSKDVQKVAGAANALAENEDVLKLGPADPLELVGCSDAIYYCGRCKRAQPDGGLLVAATDSERERG